MMIFMNESKFVFMGSRALFLILKIFILWPRRTISWNPWIYGRFAAPIEGSRLANPRQCSFIFQLDMFGRVEAVTSSPKFNFGGSEEEAMNIA